MSTDATVTAFVPSPKGIPHRLLRRLAVGRLRREHARYDATRLATLELFSDDRVRPDALSDRLPPAELYNLHWISGFVDLRLVLARIAPETPLVWTLHDMNPFTGGCHYSLGCRSFEAQCGSCVQLGSVNNDDISRRIHRRKESALASRLPETTRIVAPSRWLAEEARRSKLLSRFDINVIPYGLDLDTFRPRRRDVAREVFGLPHDRPIVIFAAESVTNHRKGFDLLYAALDEMPHGMSISLAAVGAAHGRLPSQTIALGRIENERLMSFAYSAADILVVPTRADNLPNVILEAMACGTPVVAFDVGGVPDLVRPGRTGLLAPAEDVIALRAAVVELLTNHGLRGFMSKEARRVAEAEYSLERQARRYLALYQTLLGASRQKISDPDFIGSTEAVALSDTR